LLRPLNSPLTTRSASNASQSTERVIDIRIFLEITRPLVFSNLSPRPPSSLNLLLVLPIAIHCGSNTLLRKLHTHTLPASSNLYTLESMASYTGPALPMQGPTRIRRHTMLPNPASSSSTAMPSGTSPPHVTQLGRRAAGPYPSPPNSERSTGGVEIKKKPRAMSEMANESGSMICETCGKGYKHASCLSKHKYFLLTPSLRLPQGPQIPRFAILLLLVPL